MGGVRTFYQSLRDKMKAQLIAWCRANAKLIALVSAMLIASSAYAQIGESFEKFSRLTEYKESA